MTEKQRDSLKMHAVYHSRKKVYYFDNNGICQSIPESVIISEKPSTPRGICYMGKERFFIRSPAYGFGCADGRVVLIALSKLREGDTINRLEELLETCKPAPMYTHTVEEIDAFICKIDAPLFYRSSDNINKKTFDYIYIDVSILSENAMKERDKYLKEHINEIRQRVAEKLKKSKEFQKYGIPINFLRVCRTTLKRKSNILEFVFELKI